MDLPTNNPFPLNPLVPRAQTSGYVEIPKRLYQGLLAATISASLYTAPSAPNLGPSSKAKLTEIILANTDTVARTVTLHLVPSGGAAAGSETAATQILPAVSLAANSFTRIELMTIIEAGGMLRALASAANVVCLTASGVELLTRATG
jgi:hypothetical protein